MVGVEYRMFLKKEVIIKNSKGLHTRAAAIISFKAANINDEYGVNLFIQKEKSKIPLSSMLALTALRIQKDDKVIVGCEGDGDCNKAIDEIVDCLMGEIVADKVEMDDIDRLLDINTITTGKLIDSITNGVIVVNDANRVVLFNDSAERITGIKKEDIIGKPANEHIQGSKLHQVLKTGTKVVGDRQNTGNTNIITNRSPIIMDNRIVGAVAVFQDISEIETLSTKLESVMEIKERFMSIATHSNDGICIVDENGIITYVNSEYEDIWKVERESLLGEKINTKDEHPAIEKVIKTKKPQLYIIETRDKDTKIITNAFPIIINNIFKGVVSLSKEETQLHNMIRKLNAAEEKIKYFKEELDKKQNIHQAFDNIIGNSGILEDVLYIASKAAKSSATVLISGESGTGKEVIARSIANASPRKDAPLIKINCGAIPENLMESELFGHVKGAFTGAIRNKIGKFELADGGTIFLDEIGDLSKNLQVKLLRVLQEMEFERVGGIETIKVNVRVIAATNKDLESMIGEGLFREDLYYRLNVISITLPPLRKRKGDIPLLADYFIHKICTRENISIKRLSTDAVEKLENYRWPGNIRELENVIERAIALSEDDILRIDFLPGYIKEAKKCEKDLVNLVDGDLMTMEEYEKDIIKKALEKYKSFNKAGKVLGITHKTVSNKAKKYNLI